MFWRKTLRVIPHNIGHRRILCRKNWKIFSGYCSFFRKKRRGCSCCSGNNCGFAELCQQAECFLILEQGDKKVCQCVRTNPESWESGKITELTVQLQITEQFSDAEEIKCYLCLKRRYDGRYIRFANEGAEDYLFIGSFLLWKCCSSMQVVTCF